MPRAFRIVTLGCKVNQYESAYVRESLCRAGWVEAAKGERADVVFVNSCMVTNEACSQSRQAIRKAVREHPGARIVAGGCYAEVSPEELSCMEGVDLVAGNQIKGRLPAILLGEEEIGGRERKGCSHPDRPPFEHLPVQDFGGRTRAFLKVQDGCRSFCSYCIVPYARGPLRSLPPQEVIKALRSFSERGYKEIVLTGIHLGKYGVDLSPQLGLKDLLARIGREKLGARIRLSSIEPNEVEEELIEWMAGEEWLCRHLHIPLQSGDDQILRRMNRAYGAREFAELIDRIHRRVPLASIGTDIMVGFPGEGEEAFENSHSLIRDLPISYLHVFPFSARKGTPAAGFEGRIKPPLMKERASVLRALGQSKRTAFYHSYIGKEFPVLIEGAKEGRKGFLTGWSDNYLPVSVPSTEAAENTMVRVLVTAADARGVIGTSSIGRGATL